MNNPTQLHLYHKAAKECAEADNHFLWIAGLMPDDNGQYCTNPLTRRDLEKLIARAPSRWQRYAGYLDKLPASEVTT